MTLTKQQIRERIDALECIDCVQQAMEDLEAVEWEPGEAHALNLHLATREHDSVFSFVNNLPPSVLAAGLRVMQEELMKLADVREHA